MRKVGQAASLKSCSCRPGVHNGSTACSATVTLPSQIQASCGGPKRVGTAVRPDSAGRSEEASQQRRKLGDAYIRLSSKDNSRGRSPSLGATKFGRDWSSLPHPNKNSRAEVWHLRQAATELAQCEGLRLWDLLARSTGLQSCRSLLFIVRSSEHLNAVEAAST